jgi:hypothetical protein
MARDMDRNRLKTTAADKGMTLPRDAVLLRIRDYFVDADKSSAIVERHTFPPQIAAITQFERRNARSVECYQIRALPEYQSQRAQKEVYTVVSSDLSEHAQDKI